MVIQFLGHRNDGCLDWFDIATCSTPTPTVETPTPTPPTPTPTPPTPLPCQICDGSIGTPCGPYFWVKLDWSTNVQCNGNSLITGPISFYFVNTGDTNGYWAYSTPTAAGIIFCSDGQWQFHYENFSQGGGWSIQAVLGNTSSMEDPCNIIGLSGVGTLIWDLTVAGCGAGQGTANISVVQFICPL